MTDIAKHTVGVDVTLREAMAVVDAGGIGVVILVDDDGFARGLLTDGNIRRSILAGADLTVPAARLMNADFIYGRADEDRTRHLAQLSGRIRQLPILDADGRPVDMLSVSEMWQIPVSAPSLAGNELAYITDAVAGGWVSSQGAYVSRFEASFADYVGGAVAVSTTSGTTALHLALAGIGVGPGDEVVVPDTTFGASANAVLMTGAVPVFADVDAATWTITAAGLEGAISSKTKAVMPVHLYGHPCDMDPIMDVARQHGLAVVEDCAEALGALYKGKPVGLIGDVGCFSFFANKVITTGEGGMITTNDGALADRLVRLRNHGMDPARRYWHEEPGFNYRMTNIQAALGLAQLEQIDGFMARRAACAAAYQQGLADIDGLTQPTEASWANSIFWLYSVLLDESVLDFEPTDLASRLKRRGVETRPIFPPLHRQPAFRGAHAAEAFPVADRLWRQGLSLPMSNDLDPEDVRAICRIVAEEIAMLVTIGTPAAMACR